MVSVSSFTYEVVGYLIVIPTICVFGMVGNVISLIVLIRGRIQGIAYSYMKAMAVLDLLSLLFILPIFIRCRACQFGSSYFGQIFEAYLFISVGDIFIKASVWTVIVFTAERCMSICFSKSVLYSQRTHRNSALASVVIIFIVATLENIPTFWYHRLENGQVIRTQVAECTTFFLVYRWFDAIFSYVIPSLLLVIFNIILVRFLIKREHRQVTMRQLGSFAKSRRFKEQTRVLSTIVGILVMFFVTMMPCFTLQLMAQYAHFTSDIFDTFRITISILVATNCSGNFILYCVLNRRFRTAFKKTMVCRCCASTDRRNGQIHPRHLPSLRNGLRFEFGGLSTVSPYPTTPKEDVRTSAFIKEKCSMSENICSMLSAPAVSSGSQMLPAQSSGNHQPHTHACSHNNSSDKHLSLKKIHVVSFVDDAFQHPVFTISTPELTVPSDNTTELSPFAQSWQVSEVGGKTEDQTQLPGSTRSDDQDKGTIFVKTGDEDNTPRALSVSAKSTHIQQTLTVTDL